MSLKTYLMAAAIAILTVLITHVPAYAASDESVERLCLNPKDVPDDSDSKFVAYDFPAWNKIPAPLQALLVPYLQANGTGTIEEIYNTWLIRKNEQASSFFGVLHALSNIEVDLGGGRVETAAQMVQGIMGLKGDRIQVKLDVEKLELWRKSNGRYMSRDGNRVEKGEVTFNDHTVMGGSIHCGYDIQGFTQRAKPPSVQWNFRFKDSAADIDLDGNRPSFWKVLPNPKHYTYRNSDIRFWFDKFLKKFDTPSYSVKLRH